MLQIVYVGGWMRSGTTLLCQALGSSPGALALGEVSGVWRAAELGRSCSCGQSITECAVWGAALDSVAA
ncbi:MAG: sulfotransferase, partial [Actinomycetota bacterium]|nr:sulfotransferase [Actinomycetota bacterium]